MGRTPITIFTKICFLSGIFIFSFFIANAQEKIIKGSLIDSSSGKILEGATITLFSLPDTALLKRTRSSKNGFIFYNISAGKLMVAVSYVGYKILNQSITILPGDSTVQIPALKLSLNDNAAMMQVVVVSSIPPVISRSDTTAYQVGAFKTRPDASVEDLLKKLPGVLVSKDGEVTVNGQKVDKFYIDGKEIPITDARAITRSLNADMLSSLETFDRRSDDSKFTGIRDTDDAKAINFKLKKIYKSSITGKGFAGFGAPKFYGIGGNGLFSDTSSKFIFSANRNNSSNVVSANPSSKYNSGNGLNSYTRLNLNGTKEYSAAFNANGQYALNNANVHNSRSDERQTFLTDSALLSSHSNNNYNNNYSQNIGGKLLFKTDSTTEITISPRANISNNNNNDTDAQQVMVQKNSGNYLSSKSTTGSNSESAQSGFGGDIFYRHRFLKKGETFRFRLFANQRSATDSGNFIANTIGYDSAGKIIYRQALNQHYFQKNPSISMGVGTGYTYPLTPTLILDGSYDFYRNQQRSNKTTYNFDTLSGKYDMLDTLTSNNFINNLITHKLSLGLNQTGSSFRYQFGIAVQHNNQESNNLYGTQKNIAISAYNFFPRAGFFYAISPQKQLNLSYNGNTVAASIDQLRPLPDFSNPLILRKGNLDLKPEFDHNFNINFRGLSVDKLRSLLLSLSLNLIQNKFTQSIQLLPGGVQQIMAVNVDGTYFSNFSINYNLPFNKGKKGNWRLGANFNYNHTAGLTNAISTVQNTLNFNPNTSINYSVTEKLLIEIDAQIWYNKTSSSFTRQALHQINKRFNAGISYELPGGLLINTDIDTQITGAQGNLAGRAVNLWNANISKRIFSRKMGEIKLSAYDILNSNKGFSTRVTDNYIETSNALVLSNLIFINFIYRFKVPLGGR